MNLLRSREIKTRALQVTRFNFFFLSKTFEFYTDNFSAKSFVSHSTAVKREELEKIDLLPRIKDKFFITPELSPTFTKKDDDLIEILGILTYQSGPICIFFVITLRLKQIYCF
jgi:hypothetical protein